MYELTGIALRTWVDSTGNWSYHIPFYTNGSLVRDELGSPLNWKVSEDTIPFMAGQDDHVYVGVITDKTLVSRIITYLDGYYESTWNNCATLAQYLATGDFIPCNERPRFFAWESGMRPYELVSDVRVGDTVCLLYADDKRCQSRTNAMRARYMRARSRRRKQGDFVETVESLLVRRSLDAHAIMEIYRDPRIHDYHFMTCVTKVDGEPVWLSQNGFTRPGETTSLSLVVGQSDSYPDRVPIFAFIKRRRA